MKEFFTKKQIDKYEIEIVSILAKACATSQDVIYKGDLKREIHKFYQNIYLEPNKKVSISHFEALLRKAEKLFLLMSEMTFKQAKAGVMTRMLSISCDASAQNRDRIMADTLFSNMAGLDAKYSGGFLDDNTEDLAETLAEIEEDKKQDG